MYYYNEDTHTLLLIGPGEISDFAGVQGTSCGIDCIAFSWEARLVGHHDIRFCVHLSHKPYPDCTGEADRAINGVSYGAGSWVVDPAEIQSLDGIARGYIQSDGKEIPGASAEVAY